MTIIKIQKRKPASFWRSIFFLASLFLAIAACIMSLVIVFFAFMIFDITRNINLIALTCVIAAITVGIFVFFWNWKDRPWNCPPWNGEPYDTDSNGSD